MVHRQQVPNDENRQGVLSKAKGQLARIALSLYCLEQAVEHSVTPEHDVEWSYSISEDTMHCAIFLMNHFIEQKFTLMPPKEKHPSSSDPDLADLSMFQRNFIDNNVMWLRKLLQSHHETITPSAVSHLRLMPPTALTPPSARKTRYPASEALCYQSVLHCLRAIFNLL